MSDYSREDLINIILEVTKALKGLGDSLDSHNRIMSNMLSALNDIEQRMCNEGKHDS